MDLLSGGLPTEYDFNKIFNSTIEARQKVLERIKEDFTSDKAFYGIKQLKKATEKRWIPSKGQGTKVPW